jgi:hypothetical protein
MSTIDLKLISMILYTDEEIKNHKKDGETIKTHERSRARMRYRKDFLHGTRLLDLVLKTEN